MKQLDTTSLRKSITFSIILAMLLLIIITATATTLIQKHRQNQRAQEYNTLVHQNIESTIKHYMQDYTNRIHRLVETTGLPELLKQRDRKGLDRLLRPKWDLMREEKLFSDYLITSDLCVAGFSYGAQKAFEYVFNSKERVDRLILLSPAFFQTQKPSFVRTQLRYFQSGKEAYVVQFLKNVVYPSTILYRLYYRNNQR